MKRAPDTLALESAAKRSNGQPRAALKRHLLCGSALRAAILGNLPETLCSLCEVHSPCSRTAAGLFGVEGWAEEGQAYATTSTVVMSLLLTGHRGEDG